MGILADRLILDGKLHRLRSDGRSVVDLVDRLEAGDRPSAMIATGAVNAVDVVAALAREALGDEGSAGLSLVQEKPPRPRLERALSEPLWAEVFPESDRASRLAFVAGLLQLYDFWDASHEAAQQADDLGERGSSAYWHGIAHRREPDPGNAAYWFRRVGRHPILAGLARSARPLLDAHGDAGTTDRLLAGGWDPMAMIDLCSRARPGSPIESLARQIQRLEMWELLEYSLDRLGAAPSL